MASDNKFSYYICGSNLHGQIQQLAERTDTTTTDLYCSTPKLVSLNGDSIKFCFTWSQVWIVEDTKVTCYGFNRDKVHEPLQKCINHTNQVVPLQLNTLIDTTNGIYQVSECGSVVKVLCSAGDGNISLVNGIDQSIIGLDDKNKLCEARLDKMDETPYLTFTVLDTLCCKTVLSVACGHEHILVLSSDGDLYSYGSSSRGQLGHGQVSVDEVKSARFITALEGICITSIAAGGWHSLAVTVDGDVYVWGWNEKGQLGLPSSNLKTRPHGQYKHLSSNNTSEPSQSHCTTQQLMRDSPSQHRVLGKSGVEHQPPLELHQTMDPVSIQTQPYGLDIPDNVRVKKVACGSRHTCVLLDSCVLMTCGWNVYGQLGHGDCIDCDHLHTVGSMVEKGLKVVDVYAGAWNTVIVTQAADSCVLMTCGWNVYGQLGHGDCIDCDHLHTVGSMVEKGLKVVDVYAGAWNTVIVTQAAGT